MARRLVHTLWASTLALLVLGWAAPALAQNGTINGRVIDSDRRTTDRNGKPLSGKQSPIDFLIGMNEATVTFELKSEPPKKFQVITDANGEFYKAGLPPGTYDITVWREWRDPDTSRATKPVVFRASLMSVTLKPGEKLVLPNMSALTEEALAAGRKPPAAAAANVSNAQIEADNKRNAELETLFKDANAASDAGNFADAIAKLTSLAEKLGDKTPCGACYVKIGEAQLKMKDVDAAEKSFLKAIDLDPKQPAAYTQLAAIYNGQKKFDEAAKMGAKANELMGAGGGGGDATSIYNQGIILWNAGKAAEARNEFAKVVKMDPRNAKAQWFLGLSTFSAAAGGDGKMLDAKAPLQEYLKLEPTGEFAEQAKALIAAIK